MPPPPESGGADARRAEAKSAPSARLPSSVERETKEEPPPQPKAVNRRRTKVCACGRRLPPQQAVRAKPRTDKNSYIQHSDGNNSACETLTYVLSKVINKIVFLNYRNCKL